MSGPNTCINPGNINQRHKTMTGAANNLANPAIGACNTMVAGVVNEAVEMK